MNIEFIDSNFKQWVPKFAPRKMFSNKKKWEFKRTSHSIILQVTPDPSNINWPLKHARDKRIPEKSKFQSLITGYHDSNTTETVNVSYNIWTEDGFVLVQVHIIHFHYLKLYFNSQKDFLDFQFLLILISLHLYWCTSLYI